MFTGSLKTFFNDRSDPIEEFLKVNKEVNGVTKDPINTQLFGNAGREHMKKYGSTAEHFGKIAEKNHRHSANNPYS
jgi:acetyl-CoA acetyltransferase